LNSIIQRGESIWGYRICKIAVIAQYIVIILWLCILLYTPPTEGYEISIYSVYPTFFWFLFILTIILGISLTLLFIIKHINLWQYSLIGILIADAFVLVLPIIRGYTIYARCGSDIFTHLAEAKYILNTGHIIDIDRYPMLHILTSALDQFTLLNPAVLATGISVTLFILYVLYLYVLGKAVLKDSKAAALLSIFGSPLLFSSGHYAFYPFLFALFLIPLIFYVMHKIEEPANRRAYYICFTILSLFIVFCHPVIAIIMVLILGALYGYSQISNKYHLGFACNFDTFNSAMIIGFTFIFWYIRFKSISEMGESVISALLGVDNTKTILTHNIDLISQPDVTLFRAIEAFIKIYGPTVIYLLVALLIVIYLFKKFSTKREYASEIVYAFFFLLSIAFGVVLTSGYFIIFELIRAVGFAIVMATIICAIGFFIFINSAKTSRRKTMFTLTFIVILCSVSLLSVFNVYPNPWILSPGKYMSETELSGVDWFLAHEDASIVTYSETHLLYKYVRYYNVIHKTDIQQPQVVLNHIPTRFGYNQHPYLAQSISDSRKNSYMIINELLKQGSLALPEEMRSTRKQYLQNDFFRLNGDITVTKLYTNCEWELWRIQPR